MKKFVGVKFNNGTGQTYTYMTDIEFEIGEYAIVISPHNGPQVVVVSKTAGFTKPQQSKAHKWVVQKVNMEDYAARMRLEAEMADIRAKMEARKEELEDKMIYEILAKHNFRTCPLPFRTSW